MPVDEINKHTHFIYTSLILVMIHAHGGQTLIQVRPLKILDLQMSVLTAVAKSRVWTRCLSFHSTTVQINHIQTILTKDILNNVLTVPKKKGLLCKDFDFGFSSKSGIKDVLLLKETLGTKNEA